jgi:cytochrome bd-type quinol oxidase subunit 2
LHRSPHHAFVCSAVFIFGLVLSAALSIFPHALSARILGNELELQVAAAAPTTLAGMLWWWLPGMALPIAYSYFIFSKMPRVFTTGGDEH